MPDVTAPFGFPYPEDTDLVRDGAADIEALAEGVNDQLNLGFQFVGTRYYTSSGTFAKADPFGDSSFDGAKLRAIRVTVVGGGGGGGGASATTAGETSHGAGGGAGGIATTLITDIASLDATVTVTRGSGGAGVSAAAGTAGGSSSFGSACVATGGLGGNTKAGGTPLAQASTGGLGGVGTTGDLLRRGGLGSNGISQGVSNFLGFAGVGGSNAFGATTQQAARFSGAVITAGDFSAGGQGPYIAESNVSVLAGSAGGNGFVIVDVFA